MSGDDREICLHRAPGICCPEPPPTQSTKSADQEAKNAEIPQKLPSDQANIRIRAESIITKDPEIAPEWLHI